MKRLCFCISLILLFVSCKEKNLSLGFTPDNSVCVGDVINTIYKKGGRIVNNVDVFDVFNNIEECKKSVAFKITYQDISKTLTDEEVTKSFENIISCVSKEYNGVLRNK